MCAYRIGQLAEQAGATPEPVCYYERRGLLAPPARNGSGYRACPESSLDELRLART
jgi:DNA-binding transcriptional MerR regulator